VASSTDAITWDVQTSGSTSTISSLTYGGSLYVAAAGSGILTSTNAVTWTLRTSNSPTAINAVTFGNNLYVYGAQGRAIGRSTDAINWDLAEPINTFQQAFVAGTTGTTLAFLGLGYGNSRFMAVGNAGGISTAPDDYSYNTSTQFQLPTDLQEGIVQEQPYNFVKSLYIRALN
jgi:hypothetical protein